MYQQEVLRKMHIATQQKIFRQLTYNENLFTDKELALRNIKDIGPEMFYLLPDKLKYDKDIQKSAGVRRKN